MAAVSSGGSSSGGSCVHASLDGRRVFGSASKAAALTACAGWVAGSLRALRVGASAPAQALRVTARGCVPTDCRRGRTEKNAAVDHDPSGLDVATPLYLLVDARTASAAEILASALQDNGRATLVGCSGARTFGKAQSLSTHLIIHIYTQPPARRRAEGRIHSYISTLNLLQGAPPAGGSAKGARGAIDPGLRAGLRGCAARSSPGDSHLTLTTTNP